MNEGDIIIIVMLLHPIGRARNDATTPPPITAPSEVFSKVLTELRNTPRCTEFVRHNDTLLSPLSLQFLTSVINKFSLFFYQNNSQRSDVQVPLLSRPFQDFLMCEVCEAQSRVY